MYDEILVPTDGSAAAERSIDEAIELAVATDARLHALYVVDTRTLSGLPSAQGSTIEQALEAQGDAAVEGVRDRAEAAGLSVTTTVAVGNPATEILAYADDAPVDAIVMGTHGRTGVDRFLLGSVTERVLRRASAPVLVVRIGDEKAE